MDDVTTGAASSESVSGAVNAPAPAAEQSSYQQAMAFLNSQEPPSVDPAAEPDDASRSDDPAVPEPAMVPSFRLREEADRRRQLEEQVRQFEPLTPYQQLVQQFHEAGLGPEDVLTLLQQAQAQQPAQAPPQQSQPDDPDAALHAWIQARGMDPYALDDNAYFSARLAHEAHQQTQALVAERARVQQEAVMGDLRTQAQQAQQQFPIFKKPEFQQALFGAYGFGQENGSRETLLQVAERMHNAYQEDLRNELARHSVEKAKDAAVPVVSGGASPAPVQAPDINKMSREQRQALAMSYLEASGGQV